MTSTSFSATSPVVRAAQFDGGGGSEQCSFSISGSTALGPNAGQTFDATISLSLNDDGTIASGALQLPDGTTIALTGQAVGRSIRLRIGSDPDDVVTFTGCGELPIDQCSGVMAGAFSGPGLDNLGVWSASAQTEA